jgi:hypothetical protein
MTETVSGGIYMHKKIAAVFLAAVMGIALCSCGSGTSTAMKIGNTDIPSDIFTYYLDTEMTGTKNSSKCIKAAQKDCIEYAKINHRFSEMKLSLTASQKSALASEVNDRWDVFCNYYKKIGVSKQTLTKVYESAAYKATILDAIYGENGTAAVSEDTLRSYFTSDYVFFKAISEYIPKTTGKDELAALNIKFAALKSEIDGGKTIDTVNQEYAAANGGTADAQMPVTILEKSDTSSYPDGFFDDMIQLGAGDVSVLTFDRYIFLVQRTAQTDSFGDYREACLEAVTADDFADRIAGWYKNSTAEYKTKTEQKCFELIENNR